MNFSRTHFLRLLLPLALAALGAGLCTLLIPAEMDAVNQQLIGFPDSDVQAHQARPLIMAALCFLPALAALLYAVCGTLDRYIVRQFTGIFLICLSALLMIWLLIDLGDKIGDFKKQPENDKYQEAVTTYMKAANAAGQQVDFSVIERIKATTRKEAQDDPIAPKIAGFYLSRSPAVLVLMIPYALLLALLYSLGKLSGHREIIAMIQSGRSLVRISLPLIIGGVFFSLLCLGLNYQWAPVAEGNVDRTLAEAGGKPVTEASNVLYRNLENRRLWLIGTFPKDYQIGRPLLDVEVTTNHEDMTLESRLRAKSASWDRSTRRWTFVEPVLGNYQPGQPPVFETHNEPLTVDGWSETPWQLIKPGLSAEYLGIPDLNSWLTANERIGRFADPAPYQTQWHYRWALSFGCLITVLLATPLGIHFSRRGAGGGAFLAVLLAGLMLLLTSISVALGAAGTIQPAHAAWMPNLIFTLLAIYLFHRRIAGQPIYLVLRRLFAGSD